MRSQVNCSIITPQAWALCYRGATRLPTRWITLTHSWNANIYVNRHKSKCSFCPYLSPSVVKALFHSLSLLITAWGDSAEALLKAGDAGCERAEPQAWVSALCVCSSRELCVFTNISGSAGGRRKRGQGGQLFLLVGLCLVPAQSLPTRGHVCTHLVVLHTA